MKPTVFSLTITNGKVTIGHSGGKKHVINSVEEFVKYVKRKAKAAKCEPDDLIIMCSSSMDFPKEYTSDPAVLKLVRALR